MPRPCSICENAATARITKDLLAGVSLRDAAARYKVTSASVGRHLTNCLKTRRRGEKPRQDETPIKFADAPRFETDADPKALIHRAELLLDDATVICAKAKDEGDSRLALQALRECRSSLELLMRAHGMLAPDATVNVQVDARRQSLALVAKLSEDELRALARGAIEVEGDWPKALGAS